MGVEAALKIDTLALPVSVGHLPILSGGGVNRLGLATDRRAFSPDLPGRRASDGTGDGMKNLHKKYGNVRILICTDDEVLKWSFMVRANWKFSLNGFYLDAPKPVAGYRFLRLKRPSEVPKNGDSRLNLPTKPAHFLVFAGLWG
ncbi:MAG: hypothetical protein V4661_10475 [Pseudomonadota bacterium]